MQKWSEMIGLKTRFDAIRNYEVPLYSSDNCVNDCSNSVYAERGIEIPSYGFLLFTMKNKKEGFGTGTNIVYLRDLLHYIRRSESNVSTFFHVPKKFKFKYLPWNLLERYAYEWMKIDIDCEYTNIANINLLMTKMNQIMEQEI